MQRFIRNLCECFCGNCFGRRRRSVKIINIRNQKNNIFQSHPAEQLPLRIPNSITPSDSRAHHADDLNGPQQFRPAVGNPSASRFPLPAPDPSVPLTVLEEVEPIRSEFAWERVSSRYTSYNQPVSAGVNTEVPANSLGANFESQSTGLNITNIDDRIGADTVITILAQSNPPEVQTEAPQTKYMGQPQSSPRQSQESSGQLSKALSELANHDLICCYHCDEYIHPNHIQEHFEKYGLSWNEAYRSAQYAVSTYSCSIAPGPAVETRAIMSQQVQRSLQIAEAKRGMQKWQESLEGNEVCDPQVEMASRPSSAFSLSTVGNMASSSRRSSSKGVADKWVCGDGERFEAR